MRHCTLNPIGLAWANMKTYIRDRNTSFTLTEMSKLVQDTTEAISYINHINKCEVTFKKADMYVEEIEEGLDDNQGEDGYSAYSTDTSDDNDDDQ